ncbi:MAG: tetratricopeptide repeat protein [Myxococcota bacterium]
MLVPNSVIDRYIVQHRIGSGGMASVYAVRHLVLRTPHALKVLHHPGADERNRLIREGRVQATLDPTHIVPVTDVLDVMDSPALLMPLVIGCSLSELLSLHRLSEPEAIEIFHGVVRGVACAHQAGVIHRDLKPSNILLEQTATGIVPRVADFGLAKLLDDPNDTRTGRFMGTPYYASPEQLLARERLDKRTDLFSLGVLLFELLAGERPFTGATFNDIEAAIMSGKYDEDAIPEKWRPLLATMLEVDPSRRPRSASDLMSKLPPYRCRTLRTGGPIATLVGHKARSRAVSDGDSGQITQVRPPPRDKHTDAVSRSSPPRDHLPPEHDTFIGRSEAITSLHRCLQEGARLVSVVGMGGVGKTRFAIHSARKIAEFSDRVWFCDLSEARDLSGICAAMSRALKVDLSETNDPLSQLRRVIAGRGTCLLILDTFEHLSAHASQTLYDWMTHAPEARFIVTSRSVLGLRGETLLRLPPLKISEAVELFITRARASAPDFNVADSQTLETLVKLLDGLPLAIELAAARAGVMSVKKILSLMGERFRLLSGSTDRNDRQMTLRATLDWSWGLLPDMLRRGLTQLTVFDAGFTLEAADAVLAVDEHWAADIVQLLVDSSLIHRVDAERFALLSSVRLYADEKLGRGDEWYEASVRFSEYYTHFGDRDALEQFYEGGAEALLAEMDNLIAACRFAIANEDPTVAVACALAASEGFIFRGPLEPGMALLSETRAMADEHRLAELLLAEGKLQRSRGELSDAHRLFALALRHCEQDDDRRLEGYVREAAGLTSFLQGHIENATEHYTKAYAIAQEHSARSLEGKIITHMAMLDESQGDIPNARRRLQEALRIFRDIGNQRLEAMALTNLGITHRRLGELSAAAQLYERSLQLHRAVGNQRSEGNVIGNLGNIYALQGNLARGISYLKSALNIHRAIGFRMGEAVTLVSLGIRYIATGTIEDAQNAFEASAAMFRKSGSPLIVSSLINNAFIFLEMGKLDNTRPLLKEAYDTAERSKIPMLKLNVLLFLGALHMKEGDYTLAKERYQEAMDIADTFCVQYKGDIWVQHALLYMEINELDSASKALNQAQQLLCSDESLDKQAKLLLLRAALRQKAGDRVSASTILHEARSLIQKFGLKNHWYLNRYMKDIQRQLNASQA